MCIGYDPFRWADADVWTENDYETEEGERQCLDLSKNLSNTEKC